MDVAVIEVGIGGQYDSTNIVRYFLALLVFGFRYLQILSGDIFRCFCFLILKAGEKKSLQILSDKIIFSITNVFCF